MLSEKGRDLEVVPMPSLYDAFPRLKRSSDGSSENTDNGVKAYPPPPHEPTADDTAVYLHSSGSTGLPKPIRWTNRFCLHMMARPIQKDGGPRQVRWAAMALPTFHAYGFAFQFMMPFVISMPVGLYEPKYPDLPVIPTPENLLEASCAMGCNTIPAVPSFVEAWSKSPDAVQYLKTLDQLVFGGGPLAKKSGDQLVAAGVKLVCLYAGTEYGCPVLGFHSDNGERGDIRTPEDWEWLQFNEEEVDLRLIPQSDGNYELHVLTGKAHSVAVENLPDVKGYATSDLFVPHPTKKGLWRISGRLDDVIVLSNAEKIVPIPQEGHITTSPMVSGAVMFGRGREQAGVLVEPTPKCAIDPGDDIALADFRNAIWPTVEQANSGVPAWSRIFKEMILIAHPSKPIPRAAKGTIIRKQAWAAYAEEIEQLYQTVEDTSGIKGISPPKSWRYEDLVPWLQTQASHVNDDKDIDAQADLFMQGFDSLTATFLRNRIIGALRADQQVQASTEVSQNFVFENPSLPQLARSIVALVDPASSLNGTARSPIDEIEEMITQYTADMPSGATIDRTTRQGVAVLLTGTTGGIGSHILAALLADDRVSKVYAFNRPQSMADSARRQAAAFAERHLPTELLSTGKHVGLTGDLNEDYFGLDQHTFDEITHSVTVVIHNAWMVHFNYPLSSFESLVAGTRKLVDFCSALDRAVRLVYTSSVGIAGGWDTRKGPVPEDILFDPAHATGNGYGSSKYVVERMIAVAREKGLEATILRVGQVCGSAATGAWNTSDWVPSMIKSSVAMEQLPETEGMSTWIPMDAVANLALEIAVSEKRAPLVLNVVHPRPKPWHAILSDVSDALGVNMKFVPLKKWVSVLEQKAQTVDSKTADQIPAIKLVQTFRAMAASADRAQGTGVLTEAGGLPLFATDRVQEYSRLMRELPPLGKEHADAWVKYWRSVGFLA
ncbi:acetyl-CoA synthetase-like protein [Phanerochaete sordida]|uniref:Acetyl-CoA synthetase-like protein n=1 Tax=Phanerochaete sordida TaxID=48140 RepID=A0A9P3GDX0_9APHY|nr:acetyl-CoA synthetase-like protein [Phanerochaete sordida]